MLLGEIGVGKSSLARRLVFDGFETDYKPTLGVDIYRYEVPPTPEQAAMTLIIWDTDGNFGEAMFRHVYMKEAVGAFIIGDVTRKKTLATMLALSKGFREHFPGRYEALIVNKIDLLEADDPELPPALAAGRAGVFHTSAMTGENVRLAFHEAAATILRRKL
jgi:GTPase SAR1 family protein